jgi:hypothetical protein
MTYPSAYTGLPVELEDTVTISCFDGKGSILPKDPLGQQGGWQQGGLFPGGGQQQGGLGGQQGGWQQTDPFVSVGQDQGIGKKGGGLKLAGGPNQGGYYVVEGEELDQVTETDLFLKDYTEPLFYLGGQQGGIGGQQGGWQQGGILPGGGQQQGGLFPGGGQQQGGWQQGGILPGGGQQQGGIFSGGGWQQGSLGGQQGGPNQGGYLSGLKDDFLGGQQQGGLFPGGGQQQGSLGGKLGGFGLDSTVEPVQRTGPVKGGSKFVF